MISLSLGAVRCGNSADCSLNSAWHVVTSGSWPAVDGGSQGQAAGLPAPAHSVQETGRLDPLGADPTEMLKRDAEVRIK